MFWKEEDLNELEGTDIVAKIGKEDAEATYARDVKPFVEVNTNSKNTLAYGLTLGVEILGYLW